MSNSNKKLNILVIEDNELEGNSAKAQLKAHNVTVVKDFYSFEKVWGQGGNRESWGIGWDIVLTDLNFPVDSTSDFKSSAGVPENQPQPIGAIIVLMAQTAKVPVKMLSKHGDTVNYPLEAMNIAVTVESGVDGRILVDTTSLEGLAIIEEYQALQSASAEEGKRIMFMCERKEDFWQKLEESETLQRWKRRQSELASIDPDHVYEKEKNTWTNTVWAKNWGGALQLLLSNK